MTTQPTAPDADRGTALLVLFRTKMPAEEALGKAEQLNETFRKVPGLRQKYYIRDPATGELGGLYIFESAEGLNRFRDSGIVKKALDAFHLLAPPTVRAFEIGAAVFEEKPLAPSAAR